MPAPPTSTRSAFEQPQWYFDKLNYRIQLRSEIVKEMTKGMRLIRLLDIGCGDGSISLPLLTAERRLVLLDMSDAMLQRARSRSPSDLLGNLEFISGDFQHVDLGTRSFDLVICLGVLSYVRSIEPFLAKLASIVAPGGSLIIECSDSEHFMSRIQAAFTIVCGALWRPSVQIELNKHSEETMSRQLQKLGLTLLRGFRYSTPLPVIRRLLSQNIHYRVNRVIHGNAARKRAQWLGTECICFFRRRLDEQGAPSLCNAEVVLT